MFAAKFSTAWAVFAFFLLGSNDTVVPWVSKIREYIVCQNEYSY